VSPKASKRKVIPLQQAREWVSFEDPEERRRWLFDATFLLSNWTCIFGAGCQGVLTGPTPELVQGCCSYGAHFIDDEDVERVEKYAARLTDDQWQFAKKGRGAKGIVKRNAKTDEVTTRLADDACIFLNRPDFARGPGCALHVGALDAGERPLDWKPTVCWQLPLRREDLDEDDGWVTSRVEQWERRHWGAGGYEFHWWCTDSPEAFVGHEPVYVALRDELVELVGEPIYELLVRTLDARRAAGPPAVEHPAFTDPGGQLRR
jgi:hypothetical protein